MRFGRHVGVVLALTLATPAAARADGSKPPAPLAELMKEAEAAWGGLERGRKEGATEAEKKEANDLYCKKAAALARRALVYAEGHPEAPEAPELLAWIFVGGLGGYSAKTDAECDAAYDLMAERYLDRDAILPVCRIAWNNAGKTHAEAFLRAAVERSPNLNVRALSCFSLGRHQQSLARLAASLDDPVRGKRLQENLGPELVRRLRGMRPDALKREAEALFTRTAKEFRDLQPMGPDFPPLGEQAEGALFRLRNLEVGCTVPEIEGEDVNGTPMKLSDFRGKVVVISFWATWCGPCMGMVPDEKALVERMKGRPFALVGVNGDDDRAKAKSVSAKEGITWRSFWNQSPHGPISLKWGVSGWPTIYVVDASGVIRNDNLRGRELDQAVELLVAEAEAATRKPRAPR